ncbi:MAG: thiol-disulfide oxidoreductase ResA [Bacillus sp. (in: firmicutes)]
MGKKQRRLVVRTVILIVLAVGIAYTLYANFTKEENKAIAKGQVAPDFVVTDLDGNEHRLSDYKGKGVFLNFWGTWCKPCEKEMPYMNNLYEEYEAQGVQILAVNVGETELAVQKFVNKHDLVFPVAIDKTEQIMEAYGVSPLPVTFLIDKEGKIVDELVMGMHEDMIRKQLERIKP